MINLNKKWCFCDKVSLCLCWLSKCQSFSQKRVSTSQFFSRNQNEFQLMFFVPTWNSYLEFFHDFTLLSILSKCDVMSHFFIIARVYCIVRLDKSKTWWMNVSRNLFLSIAIARLNKTITVKSTLIFFSSKTIALLGHTQ